MSKLLLVGAHSPKQIAVTKDEPVVNEQALEYSRGLSSGSWRLADKIAASGYGSGRSEPVVGRRRWSCKGTVTETQRARAIAVSMRLANWRSTDYLGHNRWAMVDSEKVAKPKMMMTMSLSAPAPRCVRRPRSFSSAPTELFWPSTAEEVKASDEEYWTFCGFRHALVWVLSYRD